MKRIKTEVNLASHTHQVPHIGLPHKDPDIKHINENVAPMGAIALLTIKQKGILKIALLKLKQTKKILLLVRLKNQVLVQVILSKTIIQRN